MIIWLFDTYLLYIYSNVNDKKLIKKLTELQI